MRYFCAMPCFNDRTKPLNGFLSGIFGSKTDRLDTICSYPKIRTISSSTSSTIVTSLERKLGTVMRKADDDCLPTPKPSRMSILCAFESGMDIPSFDVIRLCGSENVAGFIFFEKVSTTLLETALSGHTWEKSSTARCSAYRVCIPSRCFSNLRELSDDNLSADDVLRTELASKCADSKTIAVVWGVIPLFSPPITPAIAR